MDHVQLCDLELCLILDIFRKHNVHEVKQLRHQYQLIYILTDNFGCLKDIANMENSERSIATVHIRNDGAE